MPWGAILSDPHVWAMVAGQFGNSWMINTMTNDYPNFIDNVMGVELKHNGAISSMPYLFMWISSIISAQICNYILHNRNIKVVTVRRITTIIGKYSSSTTWYQ